MRRLLPRHATRRRAALPVLYDALYEISTMRAFVAALGEDIPSTESARLLAKIGQVEAVAVHLLAAAETRAGVAAH